MGPTLSSADPRINLAACQITLEACDEVVEKQKQFIGMMEERDALQKMQITSLSELLEEEKNARQGLFSKPYITIPLGIITGMFLYRELVK